MKPINVILFISAITLAFVSFNLVELSKGTHNYASIQTDFVEVYYITFCLGVLIAIMAIVLFIAATGKIYFEASVIFNKEDDNNDIGNYNGGSNSSSSQAI